MASHVTSHHMRAGGETGCYLYENMAHTPIPSPDLPRNEDISDHGAKFRTKTFFFSVDGYQNIIKETKMYLTVLKSAISQVSKITTSVDQKKNGSLGTLFAILNSKHLRCLA